MKSKEAVDLSEKKKKRNVYDAPLRKPSLLQRLEQHFQIHIIRHPWGILANTIGFVLVIFQSVQVAGYKPMPQKRELFGQTFCYAGQVVISEWDKVEEILTTKPQKRTFQLGFSPLTPDHMPAMVTEKCWQRHKRNLFVSCCYFSRSMYKYMPPCCLAPRLFQMSIMITLCSTTLVISNPFFARFSYIDICIYMYTNHCYQTPALGPLFENWRKG